MMKNRSSLAHLCAAVRRKAALAICLTLCTLGLGLSAGAQASAPVPNAKEKIALQKFGSVAHGVYPAASAISLSADAHHSALVSSAKEIVIHNFASPPYGAYPAWGVIRDSEGNLYGTTNGAYSDVGGGGTNNAGVVFKVDASGNYVVLYSFTGGADGNSPQSVIRDRAGNLYGTTSNGGGASNAGVVFKIDLSGHETVLYSFTGAADGGNPYGGVVRDAAGNLYGCTTSGGASNAGVVFQVDAYGHEKVLYSFTGGADGAYPNPVILDSAGNLYGTTSNGGGASNAGVVFKVDPSGNETVLYSFAGGSDGANPSGGLIRDSAGNLYGTTPNGGGAPNAGVVFKVDPSGHETLLYSFTGGADGSSPSAGLIRDSAGNLYGTTDIGGTPGVGVVFKLDPSGNETVLHTFTRGADGNQPDLAGVIRDSAGNLYGTTAFSGAGGQGAVYKLDPNGNATVLYAFPGAADGQHPYNGGVIFGCDDQLYGTTDYGGRHGAGVAFQLDGYGHETLLHSFTLYTANDFGQPTGTVIRDSAGNFYGTTFIGQSDTGFGYGVVYKVDAAGEATVLHNFTNGTDGGNPYGGVILDWAGDLYGTASGGGASNAGVVFKIDARGNYTVLYSFTGGADGGYPYGELIRDSQGNLYGTANGGGASNAGVVFKIDTSGHETVLYTFTGGNDGGFPLAGVTRDSKGNLYGTTNGGGASGAGVVFKVDTSGNETVLYGFTGGSDGAYPLWVTLARDAAGNLYGTTVGGGASNAGVVFKVDRSGNETVLYSFTGAADGGNPQVGVTLGADGNLYGTADSGGASSAGAVFEIKL
jgi:uncharacterized repeat protein (TIGR03803 family)